MTLTLRISGASRLTSFAKKKRSDVSEKIYARCFYELGESADVLEKQYK